MDDALEPRMVGGVWLSLHIHGGVAIITRGGVTIITHGGVAIIAHIYMFYL